MRHENGHLVDKVLFDFVLFCFPRFYNGREIFERSNIVAIPQTLLNLSNYAILFKMGFDVVMIHVGVRSY